MKMTIRTKRKVEMVEGLKNNSSYTLIAIIQDDIMASGISVVIMWDDNYNASFDSAFFRMNSIKIK